MKHTQIASIGSAVKLPPPFLKLMEAKQLKQITYISNNSGNIIAGALLKGTCFYLNIEKFKGTSGGLATTERNEVIMEFSNYYSLLSSRGNFYAGKSENEDTLLSVKKRDPTVIGLLFASLLYRALADEEIRSSFSQLAISLNTVKLNDEGYNFTDTSESLRQTILDDLITLSNQIYDRLIAEPYEQRHISLDINNKAIFSELSIVEMKKGTFAPCFSGKRGSFLLFKTKKKAPALTLDKFKGLFPLFDAPDCYKSLIPIFDSSYSVSKEAMEICRSVTSTNGNIRFRNFLLYGPAGCGKTITAKQVAYGMGVPYYKLTCHTHMEISDLSGRILPVTSDFSSLEDELKKEEFPSLMDIQFDPIHSYQLLTGLSKPDALPVDCFAYIMKQFHLLPTNNFRFVESELVKAMKTGGVIEIQEPTVIQQPGVLVGLNSLLEENGSLELITGEVLFRNPNTVVIMTANQNYEGCYTLNQSVLSRMHMVYHMHMPNTESLLQTMKKRTGFEDIQILQLMIDTIRDLQEYQNSHGITEGICGVRELENWITKTLLHGTAHIRDAALFTVINKIAFDTETQDYLLENYIDTRF